MAERDVSCDQSLVRFIKLTTSRRAGFNAYPSARDFAVLITKISGCNVNYNFNNLSA